MSKPIGVMVFAEQEGGELAEVSLELLTCGRRLADELGMRLGAILPGHNIDGLAKPLMAQGADEVFVVDDERLEVYRTLPWARAVADVIARNEPEIVLFGASLTGRDLAPRVASKLRTGLTADCTGLSIGDYTDPKTKKEYHNLLHQTRPAFGGNIIATIVNPDHRPQMATVREGVMPMGEPDPSCSGDITPVSVDFEDLDDALEVIERFKADSKVDLKRSQVIVAGGAGVGGKEGFELLKELAHVLGGEVGASRAAVDLGYIDHDHQVGQTGTTVRPKLYIACGISGAVQHRAGMEDAGTIIAINTDENAPIFKVAHYGIVGDLFEIIPLLIEAYKSKE